MLRALLLNLDRMRPLPAGRGGSGGTQIPAPPVAPADPWAQWWRETWVEWRGPAIRRQLDADRAEARCMGRRA